MVAGLMIVSSTTRMWLLVTLSYSLVPTFALAFAPLDARRRVAVNRKMSVRSDDLAAELRDQFPILAVPGPGNSRLTYCDSAATSQKPLCVMAAVDAYYREANSNVHRGAHMLANRATERYEHARDQVAQFVNADRNEIVRVAIWAHGSER